MKKLYSSIIFIFLSLCFVVNSCFSPLDYNGRDNGDGSINVTLNSIQYVSGAPGSRVSSFPGDSYTVDDLDYTVIFTNTATNKVVVAVVTKSNDSVSASAVITAGRWKIDVEAKFIAAPQDTYALAYETIDIQKSETINIQMKRAVKVIFISDGITVVTQFVIDGGTIKHPNDPTPDDLSYIFIGWYTKDGTFDFDWGSEWNFANTVSYSTSQTDPYILYAKWEEIFQDGSAASPFLVYDPQTLEKVGSGADGWDMDKHYKMIDDIDLNVAPYSTSPGWTPIGNSTAGQEFKGTFDGNGKVVRNLFINRSSTQQALFGSINGVTIKNLGIEDCDITANQFVAGLAGDASIGGNNTIENCYVTGVIKTASGIGWGEAGGLLGNNTGNTIIKNCYTTCTITGYDNIGGLVGYSNYGGTCLIENCYAIGIITGNDFVGGLVGNALTATLQNCVAANAAVSSATVKVNRIAGDLGTFQNNYAFMGMSVTANGNPVGITPNLNTAAGDDITITQIKTQSLYTTGTNWYNNQGWKFGNNDDNPWKMGNSSYPLPVLYWQDPGTYPTLPAHLQGGDNYFASGDGTSANPYIINTAAQLAKLAELVNVGDTTYNSAHYKLGSDINLDVYNSGAGWTPIGISSLNSFAGSFDGGGFAIKNLTINRSTSYYIGLFGYLKNANIRNLGIENCDITGMDYVGALAGTSDSSTIRNCYVTGDIKGVRYISGLVGNTLGGPTTISNCYTSGSVKGSLNFIGGLLSQNSATYSVMENCYSTADVEGTDSVGGFLGWRNLSITIRNCVALNGVIKATSGTSIKRIQGSGIMALQNNYAFKDMMVNGVTVTGTLTDLNGQDISKTQIKTETFYTTAGNWYSNQAWAFGNSESSPWKMGDSSYPLPVLYWQDPSTYPTLPAHLQDIGEPNTIYIVASGDNGTDRFLWTELNNAVAALKDGDTLDFSETTTPPGVYDNNLTLTDKSVSVKGNPANTYFLTISTNANLELVDFRSDVLSSVTAPNLYFDPTGTTSILTITGDCILNNSSTGNKSPIEACKNLTINGSGVLKVNATTPAAASNIYLSNSTEAHLTITGITFVPLNVNGNNHIVLGDRTSSSCTAVSLTLDLPEPTTFNATGAAAFVSNTTSAGTTTITNLGADVIFQVSATTTYCTRVPGNFTLIGPGKIKFNGGVNTIQLSSTDAAGTSMTVNNTDVTIQTGDQSSTVGIQSLNANTNISGSGYLAIDSLGTLGSGISLIDVNANLTITGLDRGFSVTGNGTGNGINFGGNGNHTLDCHLSVDAIISAGTAGLGIHFNGNGTEFSHTVNNNSSTKSVTIKGGSSPSNGDGIRTFGSLLTLNGPGSIIVTGGRDGINFASANDAELTINTNVTCETIASATFGSAAVRFMGQNAVIDGNGSLLATAPVGVDLLGYGIWMPNSTETHLTIRDISYLRPSNVKSNRICLGSTSTLAQSLTLYFKELTNIITGNNAQEWAALSFEGSTSGTSTITNLSTEQLFLFAHGAESKGIYTRGNLIINGPGMIVVQGALAGIDLGGNLTVNTHVAVESTSTGSNSAGIICSGANIVIDGSGGQIEASGTGAGNGIINTFPDGNISLGDSIWDSIWVVAHGGTTGKAILLSGTEGEGRIIFRNAGPVLSVSNISSSPQTIPCSKTSAALAWYTDIDGNVEFGNKDLTIDFVVYNNAQIRLMTE